MTEKNNRFILTGFSSPELMKNISESLAGRIAIIELETLKYNEFANRSLSPFYSIFEDKHPDDLLKNNYKID